jgi:hypothetical protein
MKPDSSKNTYRYLYRNRKIAVLAPLFMGLLAHILPLTALAQRKKDAGPRAIAVVTWNGDATIPTPTTSVLTPVAILVEGRYYDAELYQAQPAPLAIDSGVIYDVLKNGDAVGTFTVGSARERNDVWYGIGAFDKKGSKEQAAKVAPKPAAPVQPPDERPRLRRGAPPPPAPKEQTDAVLNTIDLDPQRPTLRRHTADERKQQAAAPVKEFVPPEMHMLVAVSDAGGPEPHSFLFRTKPGELEKLRAEMEKIARAELEKQRKTPVVPRSKAVAGRKSQTRSVPAIQLDSPQFGVFDVNGNNAPIMVYSATAMLDGSKKYITVAAWEEIDESLRKVFAQITDDQHLDVYPRLQVVDAVDADGNGRGELLFRAFGDQGGRFVLYHPGPDSLNLLFDSARGESGRVLSPIGIIASR